MPCDWFTLSGFFSTSTLHRLSRVQKEEEEAQRKQLEVLMKREQKQQELIRQKAKEVSQLQVRSSFAPRPLPLSLGPESLNSRHNGFFQQEDAKNFITLENLDQRIDEALDSPKNYNFAIDKEGRVVRRTVLQWGGNA